MYLRRDLEVHELELELLSKIQHVILIERMLSEEVVFRATALGWSCQAFRLRDGAVANEAGECALESVIVRISWAGRCIPGRCASSGAYSVLDNHQQHYHLRSPSRPT
jgi:hypothetical protein